jgi:hypothetical protein
MSSDSEKVWVKSVEDDFIYYDQYTIAYMIKAIKLQQKEKPSNRCVFLISDDKENWYAV